MAISIFPSTAAEFVSNNFVIDMNDTSNNTADTGGVKQAGPYSMSFSSGDLSFDVYLIDDEGNSVGYSNSTSINASGLFTTVVIFGVAQDEVISFNYQGSVNNADGEGDQPGAGAYLESISPSDLPSIDDTATVIGGNFGSDTEITFESGATVLPAKSITVVSGTELLVTRPDGLIEDNSPYTVRAVTTGVPEPTGTNSNILIDAITAGATPVWVTTSPLPGGAVGTAYSETLEATDADGAMTYSVTTGSLPSGLSLNSATGEISGTPSAAGSNTFTVTATDDGGNATTREFDLLLAAANGGTITSLGGGTFVHEFTSSGTFTAGTALSGVEYIVVAGGGGAGSSTDAGSGGAGGYRSSVSGEPSGGGASAESTLNLSSGTPITVTVGAGGSGSSGSGSGGSGSGSSFGSLVSTTGGGFGRGTGGNGGDGGSGGGGAVTFVGGSGTAGEGFDGGDSRGGGGGAASTFVDPTREGGDGIVSSITGSPVARAGGGGGNENGLGYDGAGGGGNWEGNPGNDGVVIVRYTV